MRWIARDTYAAANPGFLRKHLMTTTTELVTTGENLAGARAAQGLSIEDAAHKTRIPAGHLNALETGDYQRFDGVAYARSFLRLYGNFLGVDVADGLTMLEERRELAGSVNYYPFLDAPDKVRFASEMKAARSSAPRLIAVIVALCTVFALPISLLFARHYFVVDESESSRSIGESGYQASSDGATAEHDVQVELDKTPVTVDLGKIAKVPEGQLERIRDHAAREVRRAVIVDEEDGVEDGAVPESDENESGAEADVVDDTR